MTTHRITVWPTLLYRDGQAALTFLTEGLGFTVAASHPGTAAGSIAHAELLWPPGGGVMISSLDRDTENQFDRNVDQVQSVYLVHDSPDALLPRVLAAGAKLERELRDEDYGSRDFVVSDPEGNIWSVGTYAGSAG